MEVQVESSIVCVELKQIVTLNYKCEVLNLRAAYLRGQNTKYQYRICFLSTLTAMLNRAVINSLTKSSGPAITDVQVADMEGTLPVLLMYCWSVQTTFLLRPRLWLAYRLCMFQGGPEYRSNRTKLDHQSLYTLGHDLSISDAVILIQSTMVLSGLWVDTNGRFLGADGAVPLKVCPAGDTAGWCLFSVAPSLKLQTARFRCPFWLNFQYHLIDTHF